jgi:hypothetical protein
MKPMNEEHLAVLRRHMVEVIAIHADLMEEEIGKPALDERVLAAMLRVPRHLFVPLSLAAHAYRDTPLPIGFDKTISQPFISALMTDLLAPEPRVYRAVQFQATGRSKSRPLRRSAANVIDLRKSKLHRPLQPIWPLDGGWLGPAAHGVEVA